jgi:hypothetical protein
MDVEIRLSDGEKRFRDWVLGAVLLTPILWSVLCCASHIMVRSRDYGASFSLRSDIEDVDVAVEIARLRLEGFYPFLASVDVGPIEARYNCIYPTCTLRQLIVDIVVESQFSLLVDSSYVNYRAYFQLQDGNVEIRSTYSGNSGFGPPVGNQELRTRWNDVYTAVMDEVASGMLSDGDPFSIELRAFPSSGGTWLWRGALRHISRRISLIYDPESGDVRLIQ